MDGINITQADVLDWLATLPDEHATACFCDPPYGLAFMGKQWDHGVPSVDVWREVLRVLKPGGLLLAFGGTRTWHRLAVNIEDAGVGRVGRVGRGWIGWARNFYYGRAFGGEEMAMMGQWQDVRGPTGRLLCRIDAERRLLEVARNGDVLVLDLDVWLVQVKREGLAGLVGEGCFAGPEHDIVKD